MNVFGLIIISFLLEVNRSIEGVAFLQRTMNRFPEEAECKAFACALYTSLGQTQEAGRYWKQMLPSDRELYSQKNFVKDKLAVGKNYRFIISFENTLYPGYVTEKLLEAYETTAFPLYWGLDRDGYFNTDSFLNFTNFPNFKTFMMEVERLNKNLDELTRKINQPLLQREFLQHNVITDLQKILCV
jgi:hypothetical protein